MPTLIDSQEEQDRMRMIAREELAAGSADVQTTTQAMESQSDALETEYQRRRIAHWDAVARKMDSWSGWGGHYHQRIAQIYRFVVTPGQRVLEVGCSQGDLLAALEPSVGVGVDFSQEMIRRGPPICVSFLDRDGYVLTGQRVETRGMICRQSNNGGLETRHRPVH